MVIELRQVGFSYQSPDGETKAIDDLSFFVNEGEFVSIVGPSGCGKSTLLALVAGQETPNAGSVFVDGKVGFMPQRDELFEWRTVWGNVLLGLQIKRQLTPENKQKVRDLLDRYGLLPFARKRPKELSGGMRQRCALIRTLSTDPRILLLDEPFSALDYQTRLSVAEDIHGIIRKEHKTALLVTHDIAEAICLSDRIFVLSSLPASVKSTHDLSAFAGIAPFKRRDTEAFNTLFSAIWKELNDDG